MVVRAAWDRVARCEFRKIEGFPIGDDQAILALSDPYCTR